MFLIISHDVDWSRRGPGTQHILTRRSRFDSFIIERVLKEGYNPYFGVPDIIELEERYDVKSTFFFRPLYDDGSFVDQYWDVIRDLVRGGWEVGAHLNKVNDLGEVVREKRLVEHAVGDKVYGCRVHYLRINRSDYWKLRKAGFLYDSSIKYFKDRIDLRDTDFEVIDGVVVFPITVMDTYLFTYMKVDEANVVKVIARALEEALRASKKFVTILWHDSSIHMRSGRAYGKLLEYVTSLDRVRVIRCIDAYTMVSEDIEK